MKMISFVFVFIIFSLEAAACENPIYELEKGEEAPCDGFLFSPELEKQVQQDLRDYRARVEGLEEIVSLQQEKFRLCENQIAACEVSLSSCLSSCSRKDNKFLYLSLGIIIGGVLLSLQ